MMLTLVLSALLVALAPQSEAAEPLQVHFLEVGQGDAALIVSPTGKTVLIDAGPKGGDRVVRRALASAGRRVIDLAVFTHAHADHIGGMAALVKTLKVKRVLDPGFDHTSRTYLRLLETLKKHKVPMTIARDGATIDIGGGASMQIFNPGETLMTGSRSDANTNSIVLRLTHGSMSVLFTGDAEDPTERRLLERPKRLASTVLKVAHHGSRHSSSARFLAAVAPLASVISCGIQNKYGHPNAETLSRLKAVKTGVFRTDLHGTIVLESTGESWKFRTARGPAVAVSDRATVRAQPAQNSGPVRLNLNTATARDLDTLPGIGPVKAQAIVSDRRARGLYASVRDLQRVKGIGPGTLKKIHALVTVHPPAQETTHSGSAP